jgi:hypothetical protein
MSRAFIRRVSTSAARALQRELDVHKLYLLTSLRVDARTSRGASNAGRGSDEIIAEAHGMTHEARQGAVNARLCDEVVGLARALVSGTATTSAARDDDIDAMRARAIRGVGFHCYVDKSGVPHKESGDGLFVRGRVKAGGVVATYPGLVYVGTAMKYMKNYPRVGADNDYLIVRSDGSVIDAKPWGRGCLSGTNEWPGEPIYLTDGEKRAAMNGSFLQRLLKPQLNEERRVELLNQCESLERSNVFAYAHFANHPPDGTKPNVVVASVDVALDDADAYLRRFVPNVNVTPDENDEASYEGLLSIMSDSKRTMSKRFSDASLAIFGEDRDKPRIVHETDNSAIRALVLVATRDIEDGEEVWLNYRLSTHVEPPAWYTRVDAEEDARRWG